MRRLIAVIAVIAIMAMALPVSATECVTVEVIQEPHLHLGEYSGDVDTLDLQVGLVGKYLWLNYGPAPEAGKEWEGMVSFDLSDPTITSATACTDGALTFEHETVEHEPDEPSVVDVVEEYPPEENPDVWPAYRALGFYPI